MMGPSECNLFSGALHTHFTHQDPLAQKQCINLLGILAKEETKHLEQIWVNLPQTQLQIFLVVVVASQTLIIQVEN